MTNCRQHYVPLTVGSASDTKLNAVTDENQSDVDWYLETKCTNLLHLPETKT
jgi:hypothetical protein